MEVTDLAGFGTLERAQPTKPALVFAVSTSRCVWEPQGTAFLRGWVSGVEGGAEGREVWVSPLEGDPDPSCLPRRCKGRAAAGPAEAPSGPQGAASGFSAGEPHPEPGPGRKKQAYLPHHRGLPSSMLRLEWVELGMQGGSSNSPRTPAKSVGTATG